MNVIGRVESLWRYPVKSMRGEEMDELFAGFAGVYGDRLYAFRSATAPKGISLFHGPRSAPNAALSPALSPAGEGGCTA